MNREIGKVLVMGAGVAGIRAALDLAETGYKVLLTESSPAIGGILSKLDYQFPTDHCGMCRMLPFVGREYASQFCMRKSLFHDNITILPETEVVGCQGEAGNFDVTLRHRAQMVDTQVCIGGGECVEVCPVVVKDEFNEGLTRREAIYRPIPHNLPNLYVIDSDACTKCGECVKVCPADAIDLEATDTEEVVHVGAIVLAAGSGFYPVGSLPDEIDFQRWPAVLTSLEFERIVSGSGTYFGKILRPSDGREAKRIAWLQCIGSRDRKHGLDFCSSICCMFALKEAVLAKERGGPDTEAVIFYMDMRTFGKDYFRYREHAEKEMGVRLVRCRSHALSQTDNGNVVIRYFGADGQAHEETFDLVVLSVGQRPHQKLGQMRDVFGFELNEIGFVKTDGASSVSTTTPGVYVCGSFIGLKDISESLLEGGAAANAVSNLMQQKGVAFGEEPRSFAERDVHRELPKVAVLLCKWPLKEGTQDLDFDKLGEAVGDLDRVTEVYVVDEICREGFGESKTLLENSKANRLLVGACLPYVYKKKLKEMAMEAGFNSALVTIVDLRERIRQMLYDDASPLSEVRVLPQLQPRIEELCARDPVQTRHVSVEHRALVIGGGLCGMQTALSLAGHGVDVALVEKTDRLGGHARNLRYTLEGTDPQKLAADLANRVFSDHRITVHMNTTVAKSSGSVGAFTSHLCRLDSDELVPVSHGATIIATGGSEASTDEYCYGESEAILTQEDLETALDDGSIGPDRLDTVVMIQCVGSREMGKKEYCSRICCASALKNAFKILETRPDARVIVLYRDMMAYGIREKYYSEARSKGVIFSTYDPANKPVVVLDDEGSPVVRFRDEVLCDDVQVKPSLVILSTGMVPADNTQLAENLGIDLTPDGFFEEIDYKWRPVDTFKEGVYVCGLSHSPRSISEAMVMAEAAAQRALSVLAHEYLSTARMVSIVRHSLCAQCEMCIDVCPYHARSLDEATGRISVDELVCQGCGICVATCPSGAAALSGAVEKQVFTSIFAELSNVMFSESG